MRSVAFWQMIRYDKNKAINFTVIASHCAHWRGNPLQRSEQNHKNDIILIFNKKV